MPHLRRASRLIALLFCVSCKSFDPGLLNPTAVTLSPKLPALENHVRDELDEVTVVIGPDGDGSVVATRSRDVATLFERETREALTAPYGDKKGFLELKVTPLTTRGSAWLLVSGLTLFIPNAVGMPLSAWRTTVSTQLDVLDSQRRLVATYRAEGEAKAVWGLFSATNYAEPGRVVYLQAVRQCLEQIKTKMQPDLARLQSQLQ
ncbi:hypothetical protein [Hymenobacter volaticus]|uniref:Lipoprotein n=1 Tax=Hymenobacter volaticus TaxID=2932254 RepID=A0ABY4GFA2_9BACT|nr:hypothetical protein [Hymenobacter volaticus]UOQ69024.1 hypothetical protein MUN86_26335 [Hymenobacter volaticus]